MKKLFFSILILTITIIYATALYKVVKSEEELQTFTTVKERGELVVAIDENQAGYFKVDSLSYGFDYVLLTEFCKANGIKMKLVHSESSEQTIKMLNKGEIDMACTINSAVTEDDHLTLILGGLCNSNFVILTHKGVKSHKIENFSDLKGMIEGKSVIIPQNFTTTDSFDKWLDSVSNNTLISFESPSKMTQSLAKGELDYYICSDIDAKLAIARNKNLRICYDFEEKLSSLLLTRLENVELKRNFEEWMKTYSLTDEFATLTALYSDDKFIQKFIINGFITPIKGISLYDDIIRKKSVELGFDWRLVSAIAYNESRFNPNASSHKGATGIMQVMPRIARHFGSNEEAIKNPTNNIDVALKLLKQIERMLKFPASTSMLDKTSIILACYNGGIGHVIDARNLARKYGGNPNRWEDVRHYLEAKSQEYYYTDASVTSGRFVANETTDFVEKVIKKYDQYCSYNPISEE